MNKNGPIIIIEDDPDDQEIFVEIFAKLGFVNKIIYFTDGEIALDFLNTSSDLPFLIISDINLPKLTGLELRDKVQNNQDLKYKCIPYLFMTTAASQKAVIDAYSRSVQGFFVKPNNVQGLERMIKRIIEYWQECTAPNTVAG